MSSAHLERLRAARLHQQRTADSVDALLEASIGLHSTDYATPYLSARVRISGFDAPALYARLEAADGLVRVNAMRTTVHVVRADDLPMIFGATGAATAAIGRRAPALKEPLAGPGAPSGGLPVQHRPLAPPRRRRSRPGAPPSSATPWGRPLVIV